jgi:hypothetical protein
MRAFQDFAEILSPDEREFLFQLGFIFFQYEKYEKSALIFDLLFEWFPQDSLVTLPLAFSLIQIHQPETALDRLQLMRGVCESDSALWFLRSKALHKMQLNSEAARAMRMHIRLKKKNKAKDSTRWK